MNKTVTAIILVVVLILTGYSLFTLGGTRVEDNFKVKLDSLYKVNDSLFTDNKRGESIIMALSELNSNLLDKVKQQKAKVIRVDHWIDSSKGKIDTYTEPELVSSFNKRYPKDTVSTPIPIAKPVLVSVAKDLVELDGTKEKLVIKDSVIALQESQLSLKDSIITLYVNKEGRYKAIIGNKDQAIDEWNKQYNSAIVENKKLKSKSKLQRVASYIIIGSLVYMTIHK